MNKHLLKVTPLIFGALAAPLAALAYLYRRPLPKVNGRIKVHGLRASVEIIRDQWGVPHIYAQDLHDLFFAQGYAHAQDRLWQMELNRRIGHGRLAELFGPDAVDSDRFVRILRFAHLARREVDLLDDEARLAAESYVRGVNDFLDQAGDRLP